MGIRPQKSIGWGITLSGSELHEKAVDNIFCRRNLSYAGLFDHIEENNIMTFHKQSPYFTKEKFSELDENKTLFNYVEVISENYDSEEEFGEENWTVLFYPMVLSPLAFQKNGGINEFKENSIPFTYAEIEKFFPESMEDLKTVSYTIDTPPFPSGYSVVKKDDFTVFRDSSGLLNDMKNVLRKPDGDFAKVHAEFCGFNSVDELVETYRLAPDEEIIAFAEYLNIFKNKENVFELKPMVVYSWS